MAASRGRAGSAGVVLSLGGLYFAHYFYFDCVPIVLLEEYMRSFWIDFVGLFIQDCGIYLQELCVLS